MGRSPKAPSEPQVGASEAGSNPLKLMGQAPLNPQRC